MEAHLHAWLSLLLRWFHLVAGVAWIGASFYFNWLENHLQRQHKPDGMAGDLWAVHGGGFYYLQKLAVAPRELPPVLHWFKWEAYSTWISGFALLVVVFYWNAETWMVDQDVAALPASLAIATGIASLVLSWVFYDSVCRSGVARREALLALLVVAWFALLAWMLGQLLSGRAAYLHAGAAMGTVMVANVLRVIIPAQKDLVRAVSRQGAPNAEKAADALQRSRHNNYFTLPVLFIMISGHYPATYGHPRNWLVLVCLSLAGVAIRHYFNVRHLPGFRGWVLLPAVALLAGLAFYTAPKPEPGYAAGAADVVDTAMVLEIVQKRCAACHSQHPEFDGFSTAPLGVELDSEAKLLARAERVYQATVISRTMPLGNLTRITEAERHTIAMWFEGLEDVSNE